MYLVITFESKFTSSPQNSQYYWGQKKQRTFKIHCNLFDKNLTSVVIGRIDELVLIVLNDGGQKPVRLGAFLQNRGHDVLSFGLEMVLRTIRFIEKPRTQRAVKAIRKEGLNLVTRIQDNGMKAIHELFASVIDIRLRPMMKIQGLWWKCDCVCHFVCFECAQMLLGCRTNDDSH